MIRRDRAIRPSLLALGLAAWLGLAVPAMADEAKTDGGNPPADQQAADQPVPDQQATPTPSPPATQPPVAQPQATQPQTTQPQGGQPPATQPEPAQPQTAQPGATPAPTPQTSSPQSGQPETPPPEAAHPEAGQPGATKPEAAKPEAVKPEATKPEATKPEAAPPPSPAAKAPPKPRIEPIPPEEAIAVLGKKVRGPKGEDMGLMVDVLVDGAGHPRAAVIDFGGFLGVGSRKIAIDWQLLQFNPADPASPILLNLSRAELQAAPEYKPSTKPAPVVQPPKLGAGPATHDAVK